MPSSRGGGSTGLITPGAETVSCTALAVIQWTKRRTAAISDSGADGVSATPRTAELDSSGERLDRRLSLILLRQGPLPIEGGYHGLACLRLDSPPGTPGYLSAGLSRILYGVKALQIILLNEIPLDILLQHRQRHAQSQSCAGEDFHRSVIVASVPCVF